MSGKGAEFGLFFGGTVCNANCRGCNVGIDAMKASGLKPMMYDKPTFLAQIDQTFAIASKRGFDAVRLKYAGGEGLYMSRLAADSQTDLADMSQKHGIDYSQQFLSNGGLIHAYLPVLEHITDIHKGSRLEINTSIWGLEDNHVRRGTKQVEWPRVLSGLRDLEQAGLSWTLHYVMDTDCGDTLQRVTKNSLDTTNLGYFGKDWKQDPFRLSIGVMRHATPYTEEEATRSWNSIHPVFTWMRDAFIHGIDLPNPFGFFDYLMHPVFDQDGIARVVPTDRTCGTGINFAAATPAGFTRCHELLNSGAELANKIEDTLLPVHEQDPFSTNTIDFDENKPVAAALSRAFGGGGCPNDDWVYSEGYDTSFGPLQYEVYAPTTLALTLNGLLYGHDQTLAPVGKYILEVGDSLAWNDPHHGIIGDLDPAIVRQSRAMYPKFFERLVAVQPLLFEDNYDAIKIKLGDDKEAFAQCCRVWLYTIDSLDKELGGKVYKDIVLANDFRRWITQLHDLTNAGATVELN